MDAFLKQAEEAVALNREQVLSSLVPKPSTNVLPRLACAPCFTCRPCCYLNFLWSLEKATDLFVVGDRRDCLALAAQAARFLGKYWMSAV
jgi:hypothetical protein